MKKIRLFLFLGCLTASPVLAISESTTQALPLSPAEQSYRQGREKLAQGNLDAAERAFKESLRLAPDQVRSLLGLTEVALKKERLGEADQYLQKALKRKPDSAEVQTTLGRYLYVQGKFLEAEAALQKATAIDPGLADPYIELGALYLIRLNQPEKAIQAYRTALSLQSTHIELYYALSSILATTGEIDQAVARLEEAARLAPGDPFPFQLLGIIYTGDKQYDNALDAFARAIQIQPDLVRAHWARAEVFLLRGQDDQALAEYREILKIDSKFAPALIKIGVIYQGRGQTQAAEEAYQQAIALDPQQAIAYNNLAFGAAERGERLEEALTWTRKAVELEPDNPDFQDTLGWVYQALGQFSQAAEVLAKAAAASPQHAETVYHLGVVYARMGQTEEAATALKKALELDEKFVAADQARQLLVNLKSH